MVYLAETVTGGLQEVGRWTRIASRAGPTGVLLVLGPNCRCFDEQVGEGGVGVT